MRMRAHSNTSGGLLPVRRPAGAAAVILTIALLVSKPAMASSAAGLYDGVSGRAVSLEQALSGVRPGHVVVVSEEHDLSTHHVNQLAVLQTLRRMGLRVSVGLEFLYYPDQPWVDRFMRGEVEEEDFLRAVRWNGYPFEWYRPLVLFPQESGGQTRALNAPAGVTRALAQRGLTGLSDEERALLPPGFQLGSELYLERFTAAMGHHGALPAGAVRAYFAAQSAWDDTMAWQAAEFLRANPEQVLAIIVGDFHASYGGGLPDRLRARGVANVLVISQVNRYGLSDDEARKLLVPHPRYGARADFNWMTEEAPPER